MKYPRFDWLVIGSLLALLPCWPLPTAAQTGRVNLLRTPDSGVQPQALLDERGTLHLIYLAGEPSASDIFYVRRAAGQNEFSAPLRVNSQPGSAIATGTIRGAQLALGKQGRVHVVWNGSQKATPRSQGEYSAPLLYARLNDAGTAFEPQRNLMQFSHSLDGGGSIAADKKGNVYAVWHGAGEQKGEEHRRVWLARSTDDGKTFAREVVVSNVGKDETGACACCGMRAFVDSQGALYVLYRTATGMTERGMFLLLSTDKGRTFRGARVDNWTLTSCPMSSVVMTDAQHPLAAWENNGQIWFAALDAKLASKPSATAAPGATGKRKHPALAVNARGETLLVWTEGMGWKKGGSLAWQVFDRDGKPTAEKGAAEGVPVWGLPTAVALPDGEFTIIY
jgi:hypothetical protein